MHTAANRENVSFIKPVTGLASHGLSKREVGQIKIVANERRRLVFHFVVSRLARGAKLGIMVSWISCGDRRCRIGTQTHWADALTGTRALATGTSHTA